MAGLKQLRNRVKVVKSTQKITKAMQVVSAARLNKIKDRASQLDIFSANLNYIMRNITLNYDKSELEDKDKIYFSLFDNAEIKQLPHLLILVTSDRGLCGGFNQQVVKHIKADIKKYIQNNEKFKLIIIGKKGYDILKVNYSEYIDEHILVGNEDQLCIALQIRNYIEKLIENKMVRDCYLYFNEYVNPLKQEKRKVQMLPIKLEANLEPKEGDISSKLNNAQNKTDALSATDNEMHIFKEDANFEYEGKEIIREVINLYLSSQIKHALLQNQAGEEGARMTAMDNATRNAGELIDKLTLQLNRSRQAIITTELNEIISGAEAQ